MFCNTPDGVKCGDRSEVGQMQTNLRAAPHTCTCRSDSLKFNLMISKWLNSWLAPQQAADHPAEAAVVIVFSPENPGRPRPCRPRPSVRVVDIAPEIARSDCRETSHLLPHPHMTHYAGIFRIDDGFNLEYSHLIYFRLTKPCILKLFTHLGFRVRADGHSAISNFENGLIPYYVT